MRLARGRLDANPLDAKKTASLYRTLLRAGFDAGVIRRELNAIVSERDVSADDAGLKLQDETMIAAVLE